MEIVHVGRAIISIDANNGCRAYVAPIKATKFIEKILTLSYRHFQINYLLVFDLTSLQDAEEKFIKLNSAVELFI